LNDKSIGKWLVSFRLGNLSIRLFAEKTICIDLHNTSVVLTQKVFQEGDLSPSQSSAPKDANSKGNVLSDMKINLIRSILENVSIRVINLSIKVKAVRFFEVLHFVIADS
jgi:hypothetical protein